jgi:sortase A
MNMKSMKIISILLFAAGIFLLGYPTVSSWWNQSHATAAISDYSRQVEAVDSATLERLWSDALEHNATYTHSTSLKVSSEESVSYQSALNLAGNGIMGYLDIPKIHVSLPIYHGTAESVLQVSVGHLEWSSLPTGGEGNHTVLSGHRGLPSAKLFSDLDLLEVGDVFTMKILDQTLAYEVDQILIVKPDQTSALQRESGKDYVTLVTCTPYGVNTHRLLVRGHRVEYVESMSAQILSDGIMMEPMITACILCVLLLLLSQIAVGLFERYF